MSNRVTAARLREIAVYDRKSGLFHSLVNRGPVRIGDALGCINSAGYSQIQIDGRIYYGHRLAWLYETGAWPSKEIDHIDGVRGNNAISNLRDVSASANHQNLRKARSDNATSGLLGCSRHADGKWQARIKVFGSYRHLGLFSTAEQAHKAYVSAKRELHEGNTL